MYTYVGNMVKSTSQKLKDLIDSKKTVFRSKDLQSVWQDTARNTVVYSKRMVEKNLILKLDKGYYALNNEYNIYELANLIISPSYVSFNSALLYRGICFQVSDIIYSVASLNYQKKIDNKTFNYQAMKKDLFFDIEGIESKNNISIASPERAVLDCFYFGATANVDDWEKINKTYLKKLSLKYPRSVQKKVNDLH